MNNVQLQSFWSIVLCNCFNDCFITKKNVTYHSMSSLVFQLVHINSTIVMLHSILNHECSHSFVISKCEFPIVAIGIIYRSSCEAHINRWLMEPIAGLQNISLNLKTIWKLLTHRIFGFPCLLSTGFILVAKLKLRLNWKLKMKWNWNIENPIDKISRRCPKANTWLDRS